jgi:hypothetical protein
MCCPVVRFESGNTIGHIYGADNVCHDLRYCPIGYLGAAGG